MGNRRTVLCRPRNASPSHVRALSCSPATSSVIEPERSSSLTCVVLTPHPAAHTWAAKLASACGREPRKRPKRPSRKIARDAAGYCTHGRYRLWIRAVNVTHGKPASAARESLPIISVPPRPVPLGRCSRARTRALSPGAFARAHRTRGPFPFAALLRALAPTTQSLSGAPRARPGFLFVRACTYGLRRRAIRSTRRAAPSELDHALSHGRFLNRAHPTDGPCVRRGVRLARHLSGGGLAGHVATPVPSLRRRIPSRT